MPACSTVPLAVIGVLQRTDDNLVDGLQAIELDLETIGEQAGRCVVPPRRRCAPFRAGSPVVDRSGRQKSGAIGARARGDRPVRRKRHVRRGPGRRRGPIHALPDPAARRRRNCRVVPAGGAIAEDVPPSAELSTASQAWVTLPACA